jgi:hypothetical protein
MHESEAAMGPTTIGEATRTSLETHKKNNIWCEAPGEP